MRTLVQLHDDRRFKSVLEGTWREDERCMCFIVA